MIGEMQPSIDQVVRLRDGRSVGLAEFGAGDGFPVVNAHGGFACRLDVAAAGPVAAECGIRLISPDRPGVGLSDPKLGRTVLDWSHDVAEVLDQIDVDRFAVMGWSMGGQYAAAVGHALRHRVTKVAIIAGALPLTEPGVFKELPTMDRFLTRMSQRAPWLMHQWFRMMRFTARLAPEVYGRLAARALGPADGAVIRDAGYATLARMSREAARQLPGIVEEYRAWIRPWGFDPEDLTVPVDVWAGTRDQLVDPDWPHRLVQRIPNATLNIRDGGHFMAHLHYREILESLRG
jgi:pimeloyl-ACP methyl ester carboxylesterase